MKCMNDIVWSRGPLALSLAANHLNFGTAYITELSTQHHSVRLSPPKHILSSTIRIRSAVYLLRLLATTTTHLRVPQHTSMTFEHAPTSRSIRDSAAQPLPTTSRELGEVVPPRQPDGTPVAKQGPSFAKSWAHFVAGG